MRKFLIVVILMGVVAFWVNPCFADDMADLDNEAKGLVAERQQLQEEFQEAMRKIELRLVEIQGVRKYLIERTAEELPKAEEVIKEKTD